MAGKNNKKILAHLKLYGKFSSGLDDVRRNVLASTITHEKRNEAKKALSQLSSLGNIAFGISLSILNNSARIEHLRQQEMERHNKDRLNHK